MLAVLAAWIMATGVFADRIIYVDANAPGADNGLSWEDAYINLQDALADANNSEKPVEIRVAHGIYTPDRSSLHPTGSGDTQATFHLISGVRLKGGYAGILKPNPDIRDTALYKSVLSGDLFGDDIGGLEDPSRLYNSNCVVDGSYTDRTAILDGFEISGARKGEGAYGHDSPPWTNPIRSGGGMRNISGSPNLVNCSFKENNVDVYNVVESAPLFVDCRFENHRLEPLEYRVGTMVILDSSPELLGCIFENNTNGAILLKVGSPVIKQSRFLSNQQIGSLKGGAAIYIETGSLTLQGCEFTRNFSEWYGGAIYAEHASALTIKNCTFIENSSGSGGAIYLGEPGKVVLCSLTISNSVFRSNSAGGYGGAINSRNESTEHISNCVFESNSAHHRGVIASFSKNMILSGCTIIGNKAEELGSTSSNPECMVICEKIQMSNCTIADNRIFNEHASILAQSATLQDSIFWEANPIRILVNGSLKVSHCDTLDGLPGQGNISIDPCFVCPGYWDPNDTPEDPNDDFWVSGDYHLKSQAGRWEPESQSWFQDDVTSPCIDTGDPTSPIGYEPFPNGGMVNMGVYGTTAEASKSWFNKPICETIVAGDINGDCIVDFRDFTIMANHWMFGHQSQETPGRTSRR